MVQCEIHEVARLTAAEQATLSRLSEAVYPAAVTAAWPGRDIEWSPARWCAVVRGEDGEALSHVGVQVREGTANGEHVTIGGIGGVNTHPNARGRGLAAQAIGRAIDFFREQGVGFALLVCRPDIVGYYERLGWQVFSGDLVVTQRGERAAFTFNTPMTLPIRGAAPKSGVIDLMGPPW